MARKRRWQVVGSMACDYFLYIGDVEIIEAFERPYPAIDIILRASLYIENVGIRVGQTFVITTGFHVSVPALLPRSRTDYWHLVSHAY